MKEVNPKQAKFVEEYLKDSNGTRAAQSAGYNGNHAQAAVRLLKRPEIKALLKKTRNMVQISTGYNLSSAMGEADEAIEFAKEKGNANAFVKAIELKAKLNGLLIDKHEVRQVGFQVVISGIDDLKDV